MRILITGASGFIGQALIKEAHKAGHVITQSIHTELSSHLDIGNVVVADFSEVVSLEETLHDIDVVVHIAARVHIMNDKEDDPLSAFLKVNTLATLQLAGQASRSNVKRFIFLSSIGVNGGSNNRSFLETDAINPRDAYSYSKYEAEKGLLQICRQSDMELVIVRPPLVYGPRVKANFLSMINWVISGIPLPLGSIKNSRSLIALENLTSFLMHCVEHPRAANQTFLISDGEDVSTTELLKKVANAFEKKIFLLPIPVSLMKFSAKLMGKSDMANRLFSSLQVDSSKARELLGWQPVITMDEQLKKIAEAYQNEKNV
ncbi:MAG: UDP-glucose 4-epimerase [Methylophaga sp.]|nr:MAG: UDP-glucose 4-epimerase [Methylophaga sp.]